MPSFMMEGEKQQHFGSSQVRTAAEVKGRSVGVMSTATTMRPIMKRSTLHDLRRSCSTGGVSRSTHSMHTSARSMGNRGHVSGAALIGG